MGAEQSNEDTIRHDPQPESPQISEVEVQRLLDAQRQHWERKLQEVVANANAQNSARHTTTSIERDRAPYNYAGNQLQQMAASARPVPAPRPLYPNLNNAPSRAAHVHNNNNPFQPSSQDYVFVNNFGQTQGYRPAPPSARAPPRGPAQRPRSVSRNRNEPRERDVLDCVTCHARFGMRIFQCDEGHSSCNECKIRGRACGICSKVLTNRRNYDMENSIAQTKAPCPHTSEGCKLYIKIADMDNHVKECPFKEQECPLAAIFGICGWKGKLSQISSHFDNMHPSGRKADIDSEMQLMNVRNNSRQVHLVVLGVYNFLAHLKVSETDGMIYMAVQLIGTATSAMKWQYEIHVYNKSENRRKYMYTDNCCSSSDKMDDVFKAGECAVLPIGYATTFLCNEALSFKFFIKKSNEEKKYFAKNQRGRGRN